MENIESLPSISKELRSALFSKLYRRNMLQTILYMIMTAEQIFELYCIVLVMVGSIFVIHVQIYFPRKVSSINEANREQRAQSKIKLIPEK